MNNKVYLFFIAFVLLASTLVAQDKKEILFTVAGEPVLSTEFLKVFNKNRDIVAEENKKSVSEYVDLYINFKLKLKQAYDLKYDTVTAYKNELNSYKEQLMIPYLSDHKVTNQLIREVYERSLSELNASHILVRVPADATPKDTLIAYQKINSARQKILAGEKFEEVAKSMSEDPSAKENGGNLGYFTAFSMVYSFENAAYNTPIGQVSMPFKTQFGYHIVNVNDIRKSEGDREVAHIMIKHQMADSLAAKSKINEIYSSLKQDVNFEFLAKKHSDDRRSAVNGGAIPRFNRIRMIKEFADVAYELSAENEISTPFKTAQGWHIIKLLKKHTIGSFKEAKNEISERIKSSERSEIAGKSVVRRLKKAYEIDFDAATYKNYLANKGTLDQGLVQKQVLSINDKKIEVGALVDFEKKVKLKDSALKEAFIDDEVLKFYKENLAYTNEDFAFTLKEYREGLLLFDILQDKVWNQAENDSVGLKDYFENNASRYQWGKRADMIIATCTRMEKAQLVKDLLAKGKSIEQIKEDINEGATIHVLFTGGVLEEDHKKLPEGYQINEVGVSEIIKEGNNFIILFVKKILLPEQQSFKYAKGSVINDYQEYLEKKWVEDLREKYPIKINKKNLKKLIAKNEE